MSGQYATDMADDTQDTTQTRAGPVEPSSKPEPMNHVELQVVNYIEQVWNVSGKIPNKYMLQKKYPDFRFQISLKKVTFINALSNRGIDIISALANKEPDELTTEQVAAVSVVLDFNDTRSRAAKLKAIGVSGTKWQGWMKDSKFKAYLHKLSADGFEDSVHTVQEGLLRAVDRGSVDAVKFYMELTGRHTGSSAEVANVKVILARVMESIQRNVKDPETIRAVAYDFERIMRGEPMSELTSEPAQIERSI